ncbi:carbohydrate ABC transporter permease [Clostridium polynesiense]|uniref:carbohydrate ABC transporter permease n=1 Tax=Clostridium polynesiense TaxID=1325933 RepID=UPI0009E52065|nr:sugar ABC transporter permease [Clostridium polynesiense]
MQSSVDLNIPENVLGRAVTPPRKKFKEVIVPYLYLLPSLVLFSTFVYFPFFKTLYLSFSITNAKGKVVEMVGMANYLEVIKSPEFKNSLMLTFKFVPMLAIPTLIIGFILALIANNKIRGSKAFQLMFSMPMAVASAPAAIIWMLIFHPSIGLMNFVLRANIGWLTDEKYALISVAVVTIWLNLGVNFIFLLSGLKGIPEELIESASIDGANYFQKLFKIIIPMVSPTLFFVIFIDIINAFQAFGQVKLMTGGGPNDATNVLVHSIYREAFFNNRFEMASTQSVILFCIMLFITIIQFKFEKKGVFYK